VPFVLAAVNDNGISGSGHTDGFLNGSQWRLWRPGRGVIAGHCDVQRGAERIGSGEESDQRRNNNPAGALTLFHE
jgi:hypothetical protein